jgi:hypothetical protein
MKIPMGAGRLVARSYIVFAFLGRFGFQKPERSSFHPQYGVGEQTTALYCEAFAW